MSNELRFMAFMIQGFIQVGYREGHIVFSTQLLILSLA